LPAEAAGIPVVGSTGAGFAFGGGRSQGANCSSDFSDRYLGLECPAQGSGASLTAASLPSAELELLVSFGTTTSAATAASATITSSAVTPRCLRTGPITIEQGKK